MKQFKEFLQGLAPMSDKEFADSRTYFKEQHLKKGEYFLLHNKVCRHIAFVKKGTLRTFYINNTAEEITSCFCTQNGFTTSYKSFILQQASNVAIQAIEDCELLAIDYEGLQNLYRSAAVWQSIGRVVAEKEYMVMEKYASVLNSESAKQKYLRLLQEQPGVIKKASVEHVASYLGVTRRTLSRIRKEISG